MNFKIITMFSRERFDGALLAIFIIDFNSAHSTADRTDNDSSTSVCLQHELLHQLQSYWFIDWSRSFPVSLLLPWTVWSSTSPPSHAILCILFSCSN